MVSPVEQNMLTTFFDVSNSLAVSERKGEEFKQFFHKYQTTNLVFTLNKLSDYLIAILILGRFKIYLNNVIILNAVVFLINSGAC